MTFSVEYLDFLFSNDQTLSYNYWLWALSYNGITVKRLIDHFGFTAGLFSSHACIGPVCLNEEIQNSSKVFSKLRFQWPMRIKVFQLFQIMCINNILEQNDQTLLLTTFLHILSIVFFFLFIFQWVICLSSILQVCIAQHQKYQALPNGACCTTSYPGPCHF